MIFSPVRYAFRLRPTYYLTCIYNKPFSTTAQLQDRYYTKKHEWVSVSGKIGTVGISDFAQDALGDVVYVELPEKNAELKMGDTAGAIESVKAASDIYSPVSGVVTDRNSEVENSPGIINKSPYDKGWLFKLEVKNSDELKQLMDEAAYEKYKSQETSD